MNRIAVIAVVVFMPCWGLRAGTIQQVEARGTLRWGGDIQGGEPYVFQDPQDSSRLVGFEVEIADALARRLGVRAEFVQNDWQTLIASLERGDFDIILNGLEVTAARQGRVAFTQPYYRFTETLVVRRESAAHSLADLQQQRVGTLSGSLAEDLLKSAGGIAIVLYEGVEEPYIDLERGRLQGVLLDNIIAESVRLRPPRLAGGGDRRRGDLCDRGATGQHRTVARH